MGHKPLRIVHLMSSFKGGGMEHFVLRLAAAQRRRGHDASILAFQPGALKEHADRLEVPAEVLRSKPMPVRVVEGAARVARRWPHVVHAHNPTSLHYGVIGKLVSGARLVFTDHRGILREPTTFEWLLTDAVIAVSRDTAELCPAAKLTSVQVIHNGVDPARPLRSRAEVRAELGLGLDEVVAIQVANLLPVKAHDILLRALAILRDAGSRLTMLVVGDGPERPFIEAMARELGLGPERLRLLGFRADVPDLLGAADFFALPSRMEGLPLSALEAMAQRLPVVASKVGGLPEVVLDGQHGFLVPPADPEALAKAMGKLAGDPELRRTLGGAAYARARAEFSFEHMTQKYDDLYERLVRHETARARR
jgi:glycosyltransferase involved in cell wall biosynthesis